MRTLISKYLVYILLAMTLMCCAIGLSIVFADSPADIPPPKQNFSEESQCVAPIEVMRKNHFEFLLDHRDDAVIDGIRTKKHSLKECINCHITANTEHKFARYSEDTHFCASCHQYAAVNIDCFQCHADRPEEAIRKELNANQKPGQDVSQTDEENIKSYLQFSTLEHQ